MMKNGSHMIKNTLNDSDVSGNVMAWLADKTRDEGIRHEDQYLCRICSTIVFERDFNHDYRMCKPCVKDLT